MTAVQESLIHGVRSGADISDDGLYRYLLWREWDRTKDSMVWVMLNPSTADAQVNDPTITRCIGFAKREGCGGIVVLNLFALRATDPLELLDHPIPEGPRNSEVWRQVLDYYHRGPIVAGWGAMANRLNDRGIFSWSLVSEDTSTWRCLGRTKDGSPRHPLYLPSQQPLEELA